MKTKQNTVKRLGIAVATLSLIVACASTGALAAPAAAAGTGGKQTSTITAVFPDTTLTLDQTSIVTGTVSPRVAGRTVTMSLYKDGSPVYTLGTSTTNTSGAYAIPFPSDWLNVAAVRVSVQESDAYESAVSDTTTVSVSPAYRPASPSANFSFMSGIGATDAKWRWNPCSPITYRVNTAGARPGVLSDVKAAFDRVHDATGLRFTYVGSSTIKNPLDPRSVYPAGTDIVISWTSPAEVPDLSGSAVALSGPVGYGTDGYLAASGIAVDAADMRDNPSGFTFGTSRGVILMHEIGHAVGLNHSPSATQVMYGGGAIQATRWGASDLAGFRLIGAAQGCAKG